MELINKLIVKNFPGLEDGEYLLSQDTILLGKSGTGKTSFINAIVWLILGGGINGRAIPGITNETKVISRGYYDMFREGNGSSSVMSGMMRGGFKSKELLLSSIIPGYLLSSNGFSNKDIIEILIGKQIKDIQVSSGGKTITKIQKELKKIDSSYMLNLKSINRGLINELENLNSAGVDLRDKIIDIRTFFSMANTLMKQPGPENTFTNNILRLFGLRMGDDKVQKAYKIYLESIKNKKDKEVLLKDLEYINKELLRHINVYLNKVGIQCTNLEKRELSFNVGINGTVYNYYELHGLYKLKADVGFSKLIQSKLLTGLSSNRSLLLLIDNYCEGLEEEIIDDILMEAGASQVIITSRSKDKKLKFIL